MHKLLYKLDELNEMNNNWNCGHTTTTDIIYFIFGVLTSLLAIFQLFHGNQF